MNILRTRVGFLLQVLCLSLLTACGGGSGGGGAQAPADNNPPPPPSAADLQAAAKLLSLATFGPTFAEIEQVAGQGQAAWLEAQLQQPASLHLPVVQSYIDRYGNNPAAELPPLTYRRFAFWERALSAPDQLRQLTAYALSQIFVVSDNVDAIVIDPRALASYYDVLLTHGFGNYRELLRAVTLHPAMGVYLSHVNNSRSNPAANTFPDENYAREVMQLFSIGLFELNADGSRVLDAAGQPVPTYDNSNIREFSKIFTGLSYGAAGPGGASFFGNPVPVMHVPMVMFDSFHEPGEKTLLNGRLVPAGQTGMQDLDDAIDNLFNHPNVGPFIGRQLIQRLVTSNPSPEYIARVTAAFNGESTGVRGDMAAVVRAVLTDPEAAAGIRLREPFRRYLALNRSLQAAGEDGTYAGLGFVGQFLTGQHVLSAPSVFNFYSPDFAPPGALKDQGLIAPEFQITNASTVVGVTNLVAYALFSEQSVDVPEGFARIVPDLQEYTDLAEDANGLVERIDLVFYAGDMDAATAGVLQAYAAATLTATADPELTAKATLYLALIAPAYAVAGGAQ